MAMTASDYQHAALQLLPTGAAWDKSSGSQLSNVASAVGDELARVDSLLKQIMSEKNPELALLLIQEWEQFTGHHECLIDTNDTLEARRGVISTKLRSIGSLSLHFLEQLAEKRGYKISIIDCYPHHCRRPVTYPLYNQHYWWLAKVIVHNTVKQYATTLDTVTTRLVTAEAGAIECLLERYKPAHINFIYVSEA